MNKLFLGFSKTVELPPGNFLFIDDEVPDIAKARIFDPTKSSFNPLHALDYKHARDLAEVLYTTTPQGENTLTVRNGKRALLQALLTKPPKKTHRLDNLQGTEEVEDMIADLLASPVLKHTFCNPLTPFSFKKNSVILARINRAELGDFDALVLGLVLINHYKGQLVIPDFGFYGRAVHSNLIRQQRLIAGVNYLAELPLQLRRSVLSIQDVTPSTTLHEDAEILAEYAGYAKGTVGFSDFVKAAISSPL